MIHYNDRNQSDILSWNNKINYTSPCYIHGPKSFWFDGRNLEEIKARLELWNLLQDLKLSWPQRHCYCCLELMLKLDNFSVILGYLNSKKWSQWSWKWKLFEIGQGYCYNVTVIFLWCCFFFSSPFLWWFHGLFIGGSAGYSVLIQFYLIISKRYG